MFDDILEDVESVFASNTWKANNIKTFPANYQGDIGPNVKEHIQVNVLPSRSNNYAYGAKKETNGLVAIKMFVKAGEGQGKTMALADLLDIVLQNKTLPNGTSLGTSYLNVEGLDPLNKSLYSASYIIPFTRYGE